MPESGGFWPWQPVEPGNDNRPTSTQLVGAEYGVSDQQQREMDEQVGIDRETEAAQMAGPRQNTSPEWMRNAGDDFEDAAESAVPGAEQVRKFGLVLAGLVVVVGVGAALYLLRPLLTVFAKVVG